MTTPARSPLARTAYGRPVVRVHRTRPELPKVVVAHDIPLVAAVVRRVLHDRVDVVGETLFGQAAVALCELFTPQVVVTGEVLGDGLVDTHLPGFLRGGSRVLVVAEPMDSARLLDLVDKGVTGLVDTDAGPDELAAGLLVVAGGGVWLPPSVVASIVGEWRLARRGRSGAGGAAELTSRELEVLNAMSDGLSTKAVARLLGITPKTVENHKTRIFDKLGVRTQAQAVAAAAAGRGGPALRLLRPGPTS